MIKFYNSLTQKKEEFVPIQKGKVGLYTCGPTVYDYSHIGNFRTFLFEDLLKRVLLAIGYKVHHVMNITDVDDKCQRIFMNFPKIQKVHWILRSNSKNYKVKFGAVKKHAKKSMPIL